MTSYPSPFQLKYTERDRKERKLEKKALTDAYAPQRYKAEPANLTGMKEDAHGDYIKYSNFIVLRNWLLDNIGDEE